MTSSEAPGFREWPVATPSDVGFAADLSDQVDHAHESGELTGVHGIVIARHGRLVLERYYVGQDNRSGFPLGEVQFDRHTLHDQRSVSKSIVSLLYGIALKEGLVPDVEATLVDQFPAYRDLIADPERRRMTIEDAMTMRLGIDWDETISYADPSNGERAMEAAPDRYRYILERPFVTQPGGVWNYCGGATALLGHLIARGAGMPLLDYARSRLFEPLAISASEWSLSSNGEASAASGLRLTPRDLTKIGQLVLNGGRWGSQQIVAEEWLQASLIPRTETNGDLSYGYQWWLGELNDGEPFYIATGNGGQRLFISPSRGIVFAVTAGAYNNFDFWRTLVSLTGLILRASAK